MYFEKLTQFPIMNSYIYIVCLFAHHAAMVIQKSLWSNAKQKQTHDSLGTSAEK
jgi:hypothetical protein